MDPARQYYVDSQAILKLTNRTLTAFAVRGGKSVLVPDLATDLGRVSADGLTWTFTLKTGLTYEDDTPVTAADWAALDKTLLTDSVPALPAGNDRSASVFGTKVAGVVNDPDVGMPDLSALWVRP